MAVASTIRAVFSHFQNLNLLALMHDLRMGRTMQRGWLSGSLLCPVAHGLADGNQVHELHVLGQAADLSAGCAHAARCLGADAHALLYFVRCWDEGTIQSNQLLRQLEEIWAERLDDALVMQRFLLEAAADRCCSA